MLGEREQLPLHHDIRRINYIFRRQAGEGQYDKGYSFPDFLFCCSLDTEYNQHEAGILGFADEPFSFFEQVAPLVGYKAFSYCFPSDKRKAGYLSLGNYSRVSSTSYTPLSRAFQRSTYALKLDEVVVNGVALVTTPAEMIVDTGAKWTILLAHTFDQLDTVITEAIKPLKYNPVELKFDMGVTLTLPPQSSFLIDKDFGLCSYFMRDSGLISGVQILGNSMTRSVGVTFDIQGSRFAFRNGDC
ncbi:hypothetical protein ZWY2020_035364 [Hordeum vulgare]|nr:hypothetical protein ZWY2020_035364 [Hordeum vulgare]